MLGVILGHTELALDSVKPGQPLHSDLLEVQKAARRSADLTRQLLGFARRQTISPKVLDLNETVEGMLKMLRRLIGENISLVWHPGKNLWPVKMDPSQVDQILANLCGNARDAVAGVGVIKMQTQNVALLENDCAGQPPWFLPGEYVVLSVCDDGCGMDGEVIEKIFDPFFTTKDVGKGTGLGLATVYGIVKQNEGFITVRSEPGKGAAFKIYLPRHGAEPGEARDSIGPGPFPQGRGTVLLVEDEPLLLKMCRAMLEKFGYRVLFAGSPGEALKTAREYDGGIDLLLTDVVMPGMSGTELAARVKGIYPGLKVLLMSGHTAEAVAGHALPAEGVHFIQKPYLMQDFAAKVRQLLDQPLGD